MKEQENHSRTERRLSAAQRKNQRLHTSLQDLEQKLPGLEQQLQDFNRAKAQIAVRPVPDTFRPVNEAYVQAAVFHRRSDLD